MLLDAFYLIDLLGNLQMFRQTKNYFMCYVLYFIFCILGITLTAYSPLGGPGRPSKIKADDEPFLLEDKAVKSIADKHKVTAAQVSAIKITLCLIKFNLIVYSKCSRYYLRF